MVRFKQLFLLVLISLFFTGCAIVPKRPVVMSPLGMYHIVASGQNLYRISMVYGVEVNAIMSANNIKDPNQIEVGQRLLIPQAGLPVYIAPHPLLGLESVEKLVGAKKYKMRWKTITLHHSGTKEGSAESFNRNHRHRGMGGLFYHFVIGNGAGSGDGEIEVGWRWRKQAEANRKQDIQICLVGDFNKQEVSFAQRMSLIKLIKVLQKQYSIALYNIRTHKHIPGRITECPGNKFPLENILSELRKR